MKQAKAKNMFKTNDIKPRKKCRILFSDGKIRNQKYHLQWKIALRSVQ